MEEELLGIVVDEDRIVEEALGKIALAQLCVINTINEAGYTITGINAHFEIETKGGLKHRTQVSLITSKVAMQEALE